MQKALRLQQNYSCKTEVAPAGTEDFPSPIAGPIIAVNGSGRDPSDLK